MPRYRFELNGPTDGELTDACGFAVVGEPVTPQVTKVIFLADATALTDLITRAAFAGWKFLEEVVEDPTP
jgi:hypothetical protein